MKFRSLLIAGLACTLITVSACGFVTTDIGKILANPRAYDRKTITISGTVNERFSLLMIKYFTLRDSTGEIIVVTSRMLPSIGEKLRIKGQVEEAFSLGDQQALVFREIASE